jgi:hypothetical protein
MFNSVFGESAKGNRRRKRTFIATLEVRSSQWHVGRIFGDSVVKETIAKAVVLCWQEGKSFE